MSAAPDEVAYLRAVVGASAVAADALRIMEDVAERLAPERSAGLAAEVEGRCTEPLAQARAALAAAAAPADLASFDALFAAAFGHTLACVARFTGFPRAPAHERIAHILTALHHHAQAQEHFYPIRLLLPPFRAYWGADIPAASAEARHAPLLHVGRGGHHGGCSIYVPEQYDETQAWPVIVALHGGSGNGRDFLWTWVRTAKTHGYVVVAPSAAGDTWAESDASGVLELLDWLADRLHVAVDRVLLTGLSDGATFTLVYGLARPDRFRALAPLCGVFHPVNVANGNLTRARGVPIYLVHGARDFLFPVGYAHLTRDVLIEAGADVHYRELADLSHTYPRSENDAILCWFEAQCARASRA